MESQSPEKLVVKKVFCEFPPEIINQLSFAVEKIISNGEVLGEGENGVVKEFGPPWKNYCVKIFKKNRQIVNDYEQEFFFQDLFAQAKIKSPEPLIVFINPDTRQEFLIMEKISGLSIKDISKNEELRKRFEDNKKEFFQKLDTVVKQMHDANLHHRDLHAGNIMIESETLDPVIIDFGHATQSFSSSEDNEIYRGEGIAKNPQTGRNMFINLKFVADKENIRKIKEIWLDK
jgi:serine/threonine protein kinase